MNFIRKLRARSIESQIVLSFFTLTSVIILLEALGYSWTRQMIEINALREMSSNLKENQMQMKSASNDFILREKNNEDFFSSGKSIFLDRYTHFLTQLKKNTEAINRRSARFSDSDRSELKLLAYTIQLYDHIFVQMADKIKARGYEQHGLIGEFDKCIDHLLKFDFGTDKVAVLNLQLFVKNYLLTGDEKIIDKISEEIYMFTLALEQHIADDEVGEVSQILFRYETVFKQLVTIDRELGIYTGRGLQSELFACGDQFDRVVSLQRINARIDKAYSTILWKLYLGFFLIVSAAIITAFTINKRLSKTIVRPIQSMRSIIASMSRGEVPKTKVQFKVDDLDQMAKALNNLVAGTLNYQEFANDIGRGNLDTAFTPLSNEDILGRSLLVMRENLKAILAEQRSQMAELQRVNGELDNFTYHASHDLRAPLSTIQGLAYLGLHESSIEVGKSYFKMIQDRIIHMDSLLKDLISISYNNKAETTFEEFDFDDEVQRLLKSLECPGQNFDVYLNIEQEAQFLSDTVRVRTILSNLLSNAFKYFNPEVEKHCIEIQIKVSGAEAAIKIKDNGIGIDEAYQEKIYEMFFRATTRSTGTGLGLYIVKSMVDRLRGKIELQSRQLNGTTFMITIPNRLYPWSRNNGGVAVPINGVRSEHARPS